MPNKQANWLPASILGAVVLVTVFTNTIFNPLESNQVEQCAANRKKLERKYREGVADGRCQVLDSIARLNKMAESKNFNLPIPSQMRNSASTAKLPADTARVARKQ